MMAKTYAIVVTFNRRDLLSRCLAGIASQTRKVDRILIVDNASTDGTSEMLVRDGWLKRSDIESITLPNNIGGAGGFAHGVRKAIDSDAGWIWLMDDDAEPHPSAMAELMKVATDPANIYGSVATHGEEISWATTLLDPEKRVIHQAAQVPNKARVQSLPFLGLLIHRALVQVIGLPDEGFFIAADDIEYCIRAQRAGAQIIIAGASHIEHPKTDTRVCQVLGAKISYLRLAPWKRYYDTRNRLLIARKYYGIRLLTQTVPGSFVRLFAALIYEPRKLAQLGAFCAGMVDGLLGIKGRRHTWWGIRQ
jgi:GT2 family glycosyltransferase